MTTTTMDRDEMVAWLAVLLTELTPEWEDMDPAHLGSTLSELVCGTFGGR